MLGADQRHPLPVGGSAVGRLDERGVGSREHERRIGLCEDRLSARLAPHQAADLPGVKAGGVERHHPAREPEEELERRLPLEGGRTRPEQQHGRPHGRLRAHAAELA